MSVADKLAQIYKIIGEIKDEEPGIGIILQDGFEISFKIIDKIVKNDGQPFTELDVSDQIQIVTDILGINVEQLMVHTITQYNDEAEVAQKAADEETMAFITADEDVDDYEKFIEENKVKENLDFLKGEVG